MSLDGSEEFDAVIGRLKDCVTGDRVRLGELADALGRRAFGSLFVLVALLAISPVGAIPSSSIVFGAVMLVVSAQLALGGRRVRLPGFLARRSFPSNATLKTLDRFARFTDWLGPALAARLTAIVRPPLVRLVGAAGALLSLSMFILGPFPFGSFPASLGFIAVGLGLVARDGLFVVGGLLLGFALLAAVYVVLPL